MSGADVRIRAIWASIPPQAVVLRRLLLGALLLLWAAPLAAHPGSVAFWHVLVEGANIESRIIVAAEDVGWVARTGAGPEEPDASALGDVAQRLLPHFTVRAGDVELPPTIRRTRLIASGEIEVVAVHDTTGRSSTLTLQSTFHDITDDEHRVIARLERAGESTPFVLHAGAPSHESSGPTRARSARRGTFGAMLLLGVEHILTGYDHLVFLACLLLPGGTWRSRALIVTSFTAAHSLTLGLAAMRFITLPERFVEAAIAVSIAYVALENLLGGTRQRWPAAFLFGLVHGFGFAGMLDLLHLPTSQWLVSVLAFNLGVEVGQLAVVAVAMPVLAFVARTSWHRRAVQVTSAGVFALAVFWIVERLS